MEETEPINPYAAPKAQSLLAEEGHDAALPPRPRSVKWATFVFELFTLGWVVLYWNAISDFGAQKVWQEQRLLDPRFLLPIGLGFALLGGRRKIAYCVNAVILAWIAFRLILFLFLSWNSHSARSSGLTAERFGEAVACGLFFYLFYRFTFGLPSRRYFGFVSGK